MSALDITDFNTSEWQRRADRGDSRYAIALGLMAIAEAIGKFAIQESALVENTAAVLDDKFEELIKCIEGNSSGSESPGE
jgi:hypothetical protein